MNAHLLLVPIALASCASLPGAGLQDGSPPRTQRISLYLGERTLDEDNYDDIDVDSQTVVGLEYSNDLPDSPIGWEAGIAASAEKGDTRLQGEDIESIAVITEIYGGVRKTFETGSPRFRPYIGGGLSLVSADVELEADSDDIDDDDGSLALYGHGGVALETAGGFVVGLDLRLLVGSDLELFDESADADYFQLTVLLGYAF